jgi:hypothetical protein
MIKLAAYVLPVAILLSACVQSSLWEPKEIESKLKQIFPDAKTISILDANASEVAKPDSLNMPIPDYKALVSEKGQSDYSFIFYFYNSSLNDTSTIGKLFRTSIIQNIGVGFGGKKANYVLGMPQFDNTGNKLIVYAVSLDLPENYNLEGRDKEIRKTFALQQTTVKDVKLSDPTLQKDK